MRRLTAAIVVNDRLMKAPSRGVQAQWQPRSADELRNLTSLAQAAIGFDSARGDTLTVQDLAFDENRTLAPISIPAQMLSSLENSPILTKYLTLLVCLFVILAFGVRPALLRVGSSERKDTNIKGPAHQIPSDTSVQPSLSAPETAALDSERKKAQEILEQVSSQLKREPEQSSRLLQSWIHSECFDGAHSGRPGLGGERK